MVAGRETNGERQIRRRTMYSAYARAPLQLGSGGQENESPMTLSIIVDTGKDDGGNDARRRLISARVSLAVTIGTSASPHANCTLAQVH